MSSGKKFITNKQKNLLTVFEKKKWKKTEKLFYKFKKLKRKMRKKNYFREIRTKKGHNKTGHAKVVMP